MKRLLAALVALALSCGLTLAQVPMTGAGLPKPATGGATYSGPGDVQSGWVAYWGLNAFTAATLGNRVINACDNTGANCADMVTDATTGILTPTTLTGGTACPGANCRAKIIYDTSGALFCGGSACDATQTTAANMPKVLANQFGTLPGIVWVAANSTVANIPPFNSTTQPGALSCVLQTTTVAANNTIFSADAGGSDGGIYLQIRSTAKFRFISADGSFSSIDTSGTFLANTSYSVIGVTASGSSNSSITVNGATTTVTFTGGFLNTTGAILGSDIFSEPWDGPMGACGLNTSGIFNTGTVESNNRTIWGF